MTLIQYIEGMVIRDGSAVNVWPHKCMCSVVHAHLLAHTHVICTPHIQTYVKRLIIQYVFVCVCVSFFMYIYVEHA